MATTRRKRKEAPGVRGDEWMMTYTDMITLLLCFFVLMINPDETTTAQMQQIAAYMRPGGMGNLAGGMTVSPGHSQNLGSTIMSLPSLERGRSLGTAKKNAESIFSPEIRSRMLRITNDQRGLVITLASDMFFAPASARINMEQARDTLLRLGSFLASDELKNSKFRIEGHTDRVDVDPMGPWQSNWELSAMRSINVLQYLTAIGVDEDRFQVAGFAHTAPIAVEDGEEGRQYNRRVDVIILDPGHL